MPNPLVIVLPRLHYALAAEDARALNLSLPEGARTLWPGLPDMPNHAYAPALPWSPAQAAACLADFEQNAREGARGLAVAPLAAQNLLFSGAALSPEEQDALARLGERDSSPSRAATSISPSSERLKRESAQRALLLAWLQERQSIELAELARSVAQKQASLAELLGDGFTTPPPDSPQERELPPAPAWRAVLDAAVTLLDGEAKERDLRFLVLDRDMAEALESIPPARRLPLAENEHVPAGFTLLRAPLSAVPGPTAGGAADDATRDLDGPCLTFLCPTF